jgi:hypothetical protein
LKAFFELLCRKFGLLTHISVTTPPDPRTDDWNKADFCACSWLYNSIDDAILDFTMAPDQTDHELWVAIETHFQAN